MSKSGEISEDIRASEVATEVSKASIRWGTSVTASSNDTMHLTYTIEYFCHISLNILETAKMLSPDK